MKNHITVLHIFLHGFFLISGNLFSLIVAVAILQIASTNSTLVAQFIIALIINLGIYLLVYKLMKGIQKEIMEINDYFMFLTTLLISLALLPVVLNPLHYMSSGKWSTFDVFLATWPFQFVVNGLCLIFNYFILQKDRT